MPKRAIGKGTRVRPGPGKGADARTDLRTGIGGKPGAEGSPSAPLLYLALACGLLLAALFALFPDFDLDIWWHIRAGQMILEEGRVPHLDVFTYTATGRPWITHEWLSEVLFYALQRLGGFDLLSIFRALLAAGTLALGAMAGLAGVAGAERRARLPAAVLGVLLAAPMIGVRALARPHLLTTLFLGLTLLLLRLDSSHRERRWRLWLLPLFVLWANLHSGFVQGFMLIALYWIGEIVGRRLGLSGAPGGPDPAGSSVPAGRPVPGGSPVPDGSPTPGSGPATGAAPGDGVPAGKGRPWSVLFQPGWQGRAITFVVIVLVTLINPNHIHALLYPFRLAGRQEFTDIIVELRSILHPSYHGALFVMAFAAAAGVILLFTGIARRRLDLALLLPTVVFGLMGVRFLRGVGEFAPLVPAFLAAHGAWLGRKRSVALAATLSLVGLTLAGGVGVAKYGIPMGSSPNLRIGLGIDPNTYPAGPMRFIRESRLPGRVFNLMSFGSYMIYELWPAKQVYIDGRLEVFPPGFLREYRNMLDTGAGWDEAVAKYGISAAIVNYDEGPAARAGGGRHEGSGASSPRGLLARLRNDPEWACVYFGENAVVYARRVPENEEVLRRFGSRFDPSLRSVESVDAFVKAASPEELNQAVSALHEMSRVTPDEKAPALALGLLLDRAGRPGEAAEALQQVVRVDPRSVQTRLLLIGALARAGAFDQARAEVEAALRVDPRSAETLVLLAEIERSQGRLAEAVAALERALVLDEKNYIIPLRLGALNGQMGQFDQARRYLNRALELRPGDPAVLQNLEVLRRVEGERGGR